MLKRALAGPVFAAGIDTPRGQVKAYTSDEHLVALALSGHDQAVFASRLGPVQEGADPVLEAACRQLSEYFAGQRTSFDLPLAPAGTAFQRQVLDEVAAVPYGETTSYGEVARRIGRPLAVRAVGVANGANPLPIVIPCHRIIGSGGALTGYGGGLDMKAWLLDLEGAQR